MSPSLPPLLRSRCVALPGAFNGLVARAVARAGFDGCYVSGAAVSASYGVPDIGLTTLDRFCAVIEEVSRCSGLPVLADADTGFGEGEEMVTRVVHAYARAGAAGLHIEDQVFPKRCGHLDGKALVPTERMCAKVQRAAAARDAIDGEGIEASRQRGIEQKRLDKSTPAAARSGVAPGAAAARDAIDGSPTARGSFVVCARTDAAGVEGLESAIERARAYVGAGADMIFPEGLNSEKDFETFAKAMRAVPTSAPLSRHGGPFLLANMTEFGKTPIIPHGRFEAMGYDCVIYPVSTLRMAMGAVERGLAALRKDGSVAAVQGEMQHRNDLYALLGYTPGEEWVFPNPTRPDAGR